MGRKKLILWSRDRNRNRSRSRIRSRSRTTASQWSQWWKCSQLLLKINRKMIMLCLGIILLRKRVKDFNEK